ncbi:serine hydrolase [Lactobacillus sp. ESL0228]|uniref:serine hydrolase domain-containing protein n=1 Tax=Lactobacillus sp. ESL0228 TaxID=2069352 RepID=UPI000EFCA775|nr:serine hydrolase domain-containing protein [Lactobacillus sp. ESL0228]RMC52110.1 class A beta-lactamase-related serine hydrolase [Lactobacillus sp. ESL0228]
MKHKFLTLSAAALLGASILTPAEVREVKAATTSATNSNNMEMYNFVRNTLKKHNVRGTVTVIKNGIPQTISYGYAWYGKRIGNGDSNVVYPTASLQKVITGAMIVQLINETSNTNKAFSQYTKISRWYPNLKNANQISVGNLLTHTSGITATGTEINRGRNYSEAGAVNWVVNNINSSTLDSTGSYHYNNSNYILLTGIIRQVTGQSYEANLQKRIIDKLNLQNTYLYQNIPNDKTDPISYFSNGSKNYQNSAYIKRSLASQIPGAGNLFTSPDEYYKIQVGLTDGTILSKDDFYYLTHLKSKVSDYSGGMYLQNNDSLKLAYGSFNAMHFGTWVQLTSDNQNGIVMFLNQTNDNKNDQKDVGYEILQHIKPNTFVSR